MLSLEHLSCATTLEIGTGYAPDNPGRRFPLFQFMQSVFLARFDSVYAEKVQAEMGVAEFTRKQQALVWQWVRQINLAKLT